ncbi:hypothetical protein GINT2_000950 [Glugoides intestinalis]
MDKRVDKKTTPTFLEKIIGHTRFIDIKPNSIFLPRRLGLGYSQETIELNKTVLKSVRKQSRIEKEANQIRNDNMESNEFKESSEEVNKQEFISKKAKKR